MDIQTKNMEALFKPKSIAVIGASGNSGKLGFHVMKSLVQGGYQGRIMPINPGSTEIMGIKTFPSVTVFNDEIDLAIIVLPAKTVPTVIEECVASGVKSIVLITAGFKEIDDPQGTLLHEKIAGIVNNAHIPVVGPNTFGLINLHFRLNASFTPEFSLLKKSNISLVSQSGGISHLLAFLAIRNGVGLGKIVGIGNRLNVDFAQMVDYLMHDSDTDLIILYMEGIGKPYEFIDMAKTFKGKKPIIAYKTGTGDVGDKASRSHTGSMAGNREIYSGAFRQSGILTLDSVEDLLDTAKALSRLKIPEGPDIAILSSQAGPAIAAADICQRGGLTITSFSEKTQSRINEILPPLALRVNPVDMGPAWYNADAIVRILQTVMEDENVSGILLFMMFASANIDSIKGLSSLMEDRAVKKPVITCLSAPPGIWDKQTEQLEEAGILVNLPTPERAAKVMVNLNRYRDIIFG